MQKPEAKNSNAGFIAFLISICFLCFIYGFYAHRFQLFPYKFLADAALALHALLEVGGDAADPTNFLGYLADSRHAPMAKPLDPARQDDEWILITGGPFEFLEECPTYGCLAWLVDRDGNVVHSWETDLTALWRDARHVEGLTDVGSMKWLGLSLMDDGGLLVAFHAARAFPEGGGLARFDRNGSLVWLNDLNLHHWFTLDRSGNIYVPGHNAVASPIQIGKTKNSLVCEKQKAQLDYVAIVGEDGDLRRRIDLMDLLVDNGYAGLIHGTTDPCDPFHLNFVQYIDADLARSVQPAEPGDLLLSLRNVNALLIVSPDSGLIKWISVGAFVRQHSPVLQPDGSILIFDNLGGNLETGGSRIIRQRLEDATVSTVVPKLGASLDTDFFSEFGGHISVSDDGQKILVSLTQAGKIMEFDVTTGAPLWSYEKIFPLSGFPVEQREDVDAVRTEAFGAYYVDKNKYRGVIPADN